MSLETVFFYCGGRLQNYTTEKQNVSWEVNILSVIYHDCHECFIAALSNVSTQPPSGVSLTDTNIGKQQNDEVYIQQQHQERFRQKQVERKPSTTPSTDMAV